MTGQRIQWDAGTLITVIGEAIRKADFQATEAAIRILATTDPQRAQDVLDTIQAGLAIAEAGAR
jgi:hypothetical protein